MRLVFDKLIAEIKAEGGFRDYPPVGAEAVSGDIRRPRYEGDFATSTDASKLFEEGVNVPQEAINLTRISTAKALEKTMPDWAVKAWLEDFLKRPGLPHLAETVFEKFKTSLALVPVPGRRPRKFFDYRINQGGSATNRRNAMFSKNEALHAASTLSEQPHIAAGVLLWQFALQNYAHELAEYALTHDVGEPLKTRLVAYGRFLSASAFMLGSFGALLPLAIAAYEKSDAAEALEKFSSRGGFMKYETPKLIPYFLSGLFKSASGFKPAWPFKPRVIICSAKEAIPRWAALPVNGKGSLSAYIAAAENLSMQSAEWKSVLEKTAAIIKDSRHGGAPSACPFHGRQSGA